MAMYLHIDTYSVIDPVGKLLFREEKSIVVTILGYTLVTILVTPFPPLRSFG